MTTVVGRVCLDILRTRKSRREDSLHQHLPNPILSSENPERETARANSIGLALIVLLAVLRSDGISGRLIEIRGSRTVAGQALMFSRLAASVQSVLVNGAAGIVSWLPDGQPFSIMGFIVPKDRIVEIDVLRDPARLSRIDWALLKDDPRPSEDDQNPGSADRP